MAQTGPDALKPDQTVPDRLLDRLKPVWTVSNQTQTGADRLKPVLTVLDWLKLVFSGTNRTRPAQTGFVQLQTDSNRF